MQAQSPQLLSPFKMGDLELSNRVALAWQIVFLVIGTDPARYRLIMIPAILEKAGFAAACAVLYAQGRLAPVTLLFAGVDLFLGASFIAAFFKTRTC